MTTPNSRKPAQGFSTPSTPPNTLSSYPSSSSVSVEPKSEYLRHALEAKRAKQNGLASTPTESKTASPQTSITSQNSDPWLDQAKDEESAARITPSRRIRRPSEGVLQRMPTTREQQAAAERTKEVLFSLNMKLELICQQNNELKDQMDEANKRIAELENFEDETFELRDMNRSLELKMQNVLEEMDELRERNREILEIQDESVANMEKQNTALEEAAEIILRLEKEKDDLTQENASLSGQVKSLQRPSTDGMNHTDNDGTGNNKHPSRVYSIDESRPSTSHYGSDYYSQPASPHVKNSKESLAHGKDSKDSLPPLVTISDRARNFLTLNRESKKSIQDLKKRFSDASMKHLRPTSIVPDVPQIPELQDKGKVPASDPAPVPAQVPARTPRRATPAVQISPAMIGRSVTPRTPTDGLRGMFLSNMTLEDSGRSSRPSTGYAQSPLESKKFRSSRSSDRSTQLNEPRTQAPPRPSNRRVQTSSSHEQLQPPPQQQRRPSQPINHQHNPSICSDPETDTQSQTDASEWDTHAPSPSVVSDILTEPDADYRARWFRTVDKLNVNAGPNIGTDTGFARSSAAAPRASGRAQGVGVGVGRSGISGRSASAGGFGFGSLGQEQNFLFNPAEDEDEFMEKVKGQRRWDR
ncbi:hypothetical protein CC80DRAFT_174196 [Byssothecium circinans]|uniref:Uncharacterized protein n=1 Tax=Byssothecium circinans TaxID=147558 RepID=A0A6A5TI65_9PLEO|nr:hypothetical protein CC80DRAFT_174196 [Byssothecium circinans]